MQTSSADWLINDFFNTPTPSQWLSEKLRIYSNLKRPIIDQISATLDGCGCEDTRWAIAHSLLQGRHEDIRTRSREFPQLGSIIRSMGKDRGCVILPHVCGMIERDEIRRQTRLNFGAPKQFLARELSFDEQNRKKSLIKKQRDLQRVITKTKKRSCDHFIVLDSNTNKRVKMSTEEYLERQYTRNQKIGAEIRQFDQIDTRRIQNWLKSEEIVFLLNFQRVHEIPKTLMKIVLEEFCLHNRKLRPASVRTWIEKMATSVEFERYSTRFYQRARPHSTVDINPSTSRLDMRDVENPRITPQRHPLNARSSIVVPNARTVVMRYKSSTIINPLSMDESMTAWKDFGPLQDWKPLMGMLKKLRIPEKYLVSDGLFRPKEYRDMYVNDQFWSVPIGYRMDCWQIMCRYIKNDILMSCTVDQHSPVPESKHDGTCPLVLVKLNRTYIVSQERVDGTFSYAMAHDDWARGSSFMEVYVFMERFQNNSMRVFPFLSFHRRYGCQMGGLAFDWHDGKVYPCACPPAQDFVQRLMYSQ